MDVATAKAFPFTEARIEEAVRLVRSGRTETNKIGRRVWRDSGCAHRLHLYVGRESATFYRLSKVAGRKVETRIGDALAMRLSVARDLARKLAAGDTKAAAPVRVRTDGPTVAEAWKAYEADARSGAFVAGRKPAAESTMDSYLDLYNAHIKAAYGKRSLHALAKDVHDLHRKLRTKPATGNRLLQVCSNLFVHAARAGHWSKPNPTLDPITGRTIKKHHVESRSRWLTTSEAARVLAFAATDCDPWRDFWPLLLMTGVRVSDLREMRWSELDLRDGKATWSVPITKNGDPHIAPLVSQAVEILRARLGRAPKTGTGARERPASPWVFPMKEDATRCICDCDHAWARVKEHTGIDDIRIHDIRRTGGSWGTQADAPLPAVGSFLGDKSINAVAVYARTDSSAARRVAEAIAARIEEAKGGTNE